MRPGVEARRVAQLRQISPDRDQRLLDRILGGIEIAQDARGHLVEPGVSAEGRAYALGAIAAFQAKPCFCYKKVFGRKVKVWGLGGRCPF